MNTSPQKKPDTARRGFTLTELLVVLGMTALLGTVLLSAAFTTQERALRAECVSSLRQIGVALNIYSTEANGYVPICGWPSGQNPFQTYEVCRGSGTNIVRGFQSLGLLFRTKIVSDPRIFYCPGTAQISSIFSYATYTSPSNSWPFIPVGDSKVRAGYNYYPQLRVTETVSGNYGNVTLPTLTRSTMQLEYGGALSLVTPAKFTALNPKKSITTDLVNTAADLSHRASGSAVGLNALFLDGHVTFQTVRNHNKNNSNQPFDRLLWDPFSGLGAGPTSDSDAFRIIMNGWTP